MFPCWNVHLPERLQRRMVHMPKCSRDETSMLKWLLPKGSVPKWSIGTWAPNTSSGVEGAWGPRGTLQIWIWFIRQSWNTKYTTLETNKQTSSPNNTNNSVVKTWNPTIINIIQWDDGSIVPWSDGPMFILIYLEYLVRHCLMMLSLKRLWFDSKKTRAR
jgi:hypothetical protein